MLFPFRTSAIFRNRWIALLWAAGICFTAVQIVDSVSGVTGKTKPTTDATTSVDSTSDNAGHILATAPVEADRILK